MAFPTYTHAVARQTSNTTTHNWTLPSGNASGKLLVLLIATDGAPTISNLTGFSQIGSTLTGFGGSAFVYYKFTDGTEASGTFTTSASEESVTHALLFTGAHASTVPEIATASDTATGDADPPNLDPSGWGTEDTKWLAWVITSSNAEGGDQWTGPSGWTKIDYEESNPDSTSSVQTQVSYLDDAASSKDPPTVAKESGGSDWGAITIAIRPAAATPITITLTPIVVRPSFVTARIINSRAGVQITQMHYGVSGRQYGSFAKSAGDITITLSAIEVDATIVAPTVTTGVNIRLSPLTTTATLVAPTASAAVIVATSPTSVTATIVAPTITVGTNIQLSPLSVPATLVAPTVQTGTVVTLSPLSVAATLVAPTVVVAQQATLSPVSVTATIVAPTISWGNTVTLSPIPVQATIVAPSVSGAVTVTLSPLEVDATLVAPTVSTGVVVTLSPLVVQGTIVAPTITTGQTVVLSPFVVGATLVAPTAQLDVSVALSAMVIEATITAPRIRVISGIITVPVGSTPTRLGPYGSSATRIGLASGSATKIGPSRSTPARP